MGLYRAKSRLFLGRLVEVGEEFSSDDVPGRNWEPLDDEAKAAVADRFGAAEAPQETKFTGKPLVDIPADWKEFSKPKLLALAHKLGAPAKGTGAEQAKEWIEREIVQRIHVAGDRSREAA